MQTFFLQKTGLNLKLFTDAVEMRAVDIPECRSSSQNCPCTVFFFLLNIFFPFSFFFFLIVSCTMKVLVDLNK